MSEPIADSWFRAVDEHQKRRGSPQEGAASVWDNIAPILHCLRPDVLPVQPVETSVAAEMPDPCLPYELPSGDYLILRNVTGLRMGADGTFFYIDVEGGGEYVVSFPTVEAAASWKVVFLAHWSHAATW